MPVVPTGFEWPTWNGKPQSFIGQLLLPELGAVGRAIGLPERGLLAFFYDSEQSTWGFDPADAGSARVFWFEAINALDELDLPVAMPKYGRLKPLALHAAQEWTIPDWPSIEIDIDADRAPLAEGFLDGLRDVKARLAGSAGLEVIHRVGGYPDQIQSEMRPEVELVTRGFYVGGLPEPGVPTRSEVEADALGWRLLLQVDTDERLGTEIGDGGRLYFWMHDRSIAARDFDRAWLILQCY